MGEEGYKSSKFTVIGRYLNVPFKLNGTCLKVVWVLHSSPCVSVSAARPIFLSLSSSAISSLTLGHPGLLLYYFLLLEFIMLSDSVET